MDYPRQRPIRRDDLPLRISTAPEPSGRFRYVILRNDGMAALTSSATFLPAGQLRAQSNPKHRLPTRTNNVRPPDAQYAILAIFQLRGRTPASKVRAARQVHLPCASMELAREVNVSLGALRHAGTERRLDERPQPARAYSQNRCPNRIASITWSGRLRRLLNFHWRMSFS